MGRESGGMQTLHTRGHRQCVCGARILTVKLFPQGWENQGATSVEDLVAWTVQRHRDHCCILDHSLLGTYYHTPIISLTS